MASAPTPTAPLVEPAICLPLSKASRPATPEGGTALTSAATLSWGAEATSSALNSSIPAAPVAKTTSVFCI